MKMNKTMRLMTPLSAAALAAALLGCDSKKPNVNDTTLPVTAADLKTDLKTNYQHAAVAMKDNAVPARDEFVATSDQKLRDLDARIDALAKKSEGYKDDAKVQADKALADLRDQRDKAKQKFADLKDKGADAWDDVKAGFTTAMNDLERAYENAKSKFN